MAAVLTDLNQEEVVRFSEATTLQRNLQYLANVRKDFFFSNKS
jgi:hypothetical protein